jgi:hypothetical protein
MNRNGAFCKRIAVATISCLLLTQSAFAQHHIRRVKEFFTSGTFTVPSQVTSIVVQMWGAGGGGGAGDSTALTVFMVAVVEAERIPTLSLW